MREIGLVDVFDIVHETGAARDEVTVGGVVEEQVQVVDGGLVILPVPDERRGGGERGTGVAVGGIEIIVVYGIERRRMLGAGVGVEIPSAHAVHRPSRPSRRMGTAGGNGRGHDETVLAAGELFVGIENIQHPRTVTRIQRRGIGICPARRFYRAVQ